MYRLIFVRKQGNKHIRMFAADELYQLKQALSLEGIAQVEHGRALQQPAAVPAAFQRPIMQQLSRENQPPAAEPSSPDDADEKVRSGHPGNVELALLCNCVQASLSVHEQCIQSILLHCSK